MLAKRIKLGKVKANGQDIRAGDIIMTFLKTAPMGGLNLGQLRARVKLQDQIEAAGDLESILLSQPDAEELKRVMESANYGMADRGLLAVADAVMNAEDVTVAEGTPVVVEKAA